MNAILFKGLIDYLTFILGVPKQLSAEIVSQVDLSKLDSIYNLSFFKDDLYVQDKLKELREKTPNNPLLITSFLLGLGFPPTIVELILKYYNQQDAILVKLIQENPYMLLDVEGISFTRVDKIAQDHLNISENSPVRLKSLVSYQLMRSCTKQGHLYLDLKDFINSKFDVPIEKDVIKEYVKNLILEKKFFLDGSRLYPSLFYKSELESAKIICDIITTKNKQSFFKDVDPTQFINGYERLQTENINGGQWKNLKWKDTVFKLSKEQKDVIRSFLVEKFLVVTGLPGTGKTASLKALVDICKSRNLNVALMTPTGISAKRLAETSGHEAGTLHKFLGFDGVSWSKNENSRLIYDIIIVDEFSMVDQVLLHRLLLALPDKDFVLVFVGDAAQLPSVAPGNVLKELILNERIKHVKLTEIFRQEDTSDIVINAHCINKGITTLTRSKKDWNFVAEEDEQKVLKTIVSFATTLFKRGQPYQILSPTYKGTLGVTNLNLVLQGILNPRYDNKFFKCDDYTYHIQDRVMIVKNDYKNEVYNGEQGVITNINLQTKRVTVQIGKKEIEYSFKDAYNMIDLDYARTIHKSQSQEYDFVLLPFVNQFTVQLQRNLLYTAVTRAKKKVYIFGHLEALNKAIKNNSIARRNTIFSGRIAECIRQATPNSMNFIIDLAAEK